MTLKKKPRVNWWRRKNNQSLCLYIYIATGTALLTDLLAGGPVTVVAVICMVLNATIQGATAWRAYVDPGATDGSPAEGVIDDD